MKHDVKIAVSKKAEDRVVSIRSVSLREKILTWLFGPAKRVMVLVPGNSVDTIAITEKEVAASETL